MRGPGTQCTAALGHLLLPAEPPDRRHPVLYLRNSSDNEPSFSAKTRFTWTQCCSRYLRTRNKDQKDQFWNYRILTASRAWRITSSQEIGIQSTCLLDPVPTINTMGNICSRSANKPDVFSQPGRVLGSSAPPATSAPRAPLPGKASSSGPGRTLGGANGGASTDADDARSKAALAAQKRAEAQANASNKGKLGSQLAAQKAQTHSQTLNEASRAERAARDADHAAHARRWE